VSAWCVLNRAVMYYVVLWRVSWVDGFIIFQYPRVCLCGFDRLSVSIFLPVCLFDYISDAIQCVNIITEALPTHLTPTLFPYLSLTHQPIRPYSYTRTLHSTSRSSSQVLHHPYALATCTVSTSLHAQNSSPITVQRMR
jgi:hypothetical protein